MNLIQKMTAMQANELIDIKAAKMVLDYLVDVVDWYIRSLAKGEKLDQAALFGLKDFSFAASFEKF